MASAMASSVSRKLKGALCLLVTCLSGSGLGWSSTPKNLSTADFRVTGSILMATSKPSLYSSLSSGSASWTVLGASLCCIVSCLTFRGVDDDASLGDLKPSKLRASEKQC
uniref:Uncharacterized protein n=1 Tax=Arundo donax TaxID=35708 RepID=A0A0A9AYB0_ARUDO